MKQKKKDSLSVIGGSSLLVIFAVLCLTVFALLSLNTVLTEQRFSASYEEATEAWYAADLQAQEIFARLRAGENVSGVQYQEGRYSYTVPISANQVLQVSVVCTDGSWEVVRWQAVSTPEEGNSTLPLWQG